jgi:signal transduction histidine kinase
MDGIARRFSAAAELRGRDILIGEIGTETTVTGDRLRLEQAIGNLVDNALRHGAGIVTLAADRTDAGVTIHVADEGAGIPPAIAETAFRPFQRGPRAESGSGSGLGLAIATEIARAHDGRLETTIGPDGFSIGLILPREVPSAADPSAALTAKR